jgi:hypothetical protein
MDRSEKYLIKIYGEAMGKWLFREIEQMIKNVNTPFIYDIRYQMDKEEDAKNIYETYKSRAKDRFIDYYVKFSDSIFFKVGCNYFLS